MSKRTAERELTKDTPDEDDSELQDQNATWQQASEEKIKQRTYPSPHTPPRLHHLCPVLAPSPATHLRCFVCSPLFSAFSKRVDTGPQMQRSLRRQRPRLQRQRSAALPRSLARLLLIASLTTHRPVPSVLLQPFPTFNFGLSAASTAPPATATPAPPTSTTDAAPTTSPSATVLSARAPATAAEAAGALPPTPAPAAATPNTFAQLAAKMNAGTWECPACEVRNKADVQLCAACGEPKPGAAAAATTEVSADASQTIASALTSLIPLTVV